jgi:hypothetical protein
MIRTSIFRIWFLGLFSLGLIGGGAYAGHRWYQRALEITELEAYRSAYGVLVDIPKDRPSSRSMKSNMVRTELICIPSPNKRA